ncbi:TraK family protein [Nitrosomonas supralitoralis]|uniref:TraK protein n=1 Tax=Nitrosomonas supralitoralis TaxID=2116706 RepID=A0A2P7NRL4_9PROT|nr:TraK family protein [Nitrosomonas supralitoralis]PSJ16102.1 hypothetical protein C7H79_15310 [Nitrosomonas supralitoralis]
MEKRLSQRIADNAVKENQKNSKLNLASFIILREEIEEAMNDGWSIRYIWKVLVKEEKITFGYQTFLNYINKYKNSPQKKLEEANSKKQSNNLPAPLLTSTPKAEPEPDPAAAAAAAAEILESEPSEDRIKVTDFSHDPNKDYGNPKGFEWSTDFDPKEFVGGEDEEN